ncbi:MAG TPA: tRNA preQ1(34) S-adenosylmethionine ribosyltransferase-isomerase QueA, partial [Candidatus Staskawiczbacteria bacterium]|nr:tRNA preQ1(34) S-adenosylmethionine ribosyltransferase-isomerase QueA [Candidatus Staskawiczbacteria bacterium]
MDFNEILEKYNYKLPENLIAQKPSQPRDAAKLLIYDKEADKIFCDKFLNIAKYLPKNAVLVFNETKVLPARLNLKKETGGKVEILYLKKRGGLCEVLADRKLNIGSKIFLGPKIVFEVAGHEEKIYLLKPLFDAKKFEAVLEKYGAAPIPPYIKHSPLSKSQLKQQYQTIFAKYTGSAAAPTASLHFTKRVLASLKRAKIDTKFVTLHVGLGTFAPLTEQNLKTKKLHAESYNIDQKTAEFLNIARAQGRPIIAVGTTVARTLEAASKNGQLKNLSGQTDIFISEGYKFGFIEGIVTNFHVPKSSLLMLVAALVGQEKILEIYKFAIAQKFKFYSFGDGMMII